MTHSIDFKVIESLDDFFYSTKFISLVCGPIGSTKTTAGIMKILHHASMMAPCKDGVRRSKAVWVRNTREQLRDTSIPDFLKWIPDGVMGSFLKTEYKFLIKIGDIECEVLFRGLDDANDVRRLLSLNASFFIFDEFREIHPDIFETAQGRVGRYPDGMLVPHRHEWGSDAKGNPIQGCVTDDGKPNKFVWGMSNPPDADTFWHELLTAPPSNVHVTIQPSGLSPEADWVQFLPTDYYDNLAQGKTTDWIDVYIHAKFGKSLSGQPVFRSFDRSTHVAKEPLVPKSAASPLIIGVDAGLTPAATIGQVIHDGRVLVYDALVSDGMGALRFIREKLKPLLVNKYPGYKSIVIIDPAAFQRAQTDERTVADIYKAEGFVVKPAKTNSVVARIASVDKFLTRTVDGKAGILICPGATPLIHALAGKYRYKINTKGEREESPEKSHPWSDVCFIAGTLVKTPYGYAAVESLRVGDLVCVADGVDTVTGVGSHIPHDSLVELTLSDGTTLTCTKNHPFAVKSHSCFLPADTLTCEHVLETVGDGVWASGQRRTRAKTGLLSAASNVGRALKYLSGKLTKAKVNTAAKHATGSALDQTMGLSTTDYGSPAPEKTIITGTSAATEPQFLYTGMFGNSTMGLSQTGSLSTTLTTTQQITLWRTLSCLMGESMQGGTLQSASKTAPSTWKLAYRRLGRLLKRGIGLLKVGRGTASTLIVVSTKAVPPQKVYNLTTERTHTYYAGDCLVHNCDAVQYLCLHADGGETFGSKFSDNTKREIKRANAHGWT